MESAKFSEPLRWQGQATFLTEPRSGKEFGMTSHYRMGSADSDQDEISLSPSESIPHVLLVDDDPVFGALMGRAAEQSRVNLTYCQNQDEFNRCLDWKFDVAIIDYQLESDTGINITFQLEKVRPIPVILISSGKSVDTPINLWPKIIRGFMDKKLGHFAILEAALAAHEMTTAEKNL